MEVHELTLAPIKTEAVIIKGVIHYLKNNVNFELGGMTIIPTKSVRYLGITIDEKFGQHIGEVTRRLAGSFKMLEDPGPVSQRF